MNLPQVQIYYIKRVTVVLINLLASESPRIA